ncbi:MAG TPA: DUF4349 domain-containing protein [Allosphingosinicella sp.]|nr:DUF4349 domain-containing protein [Allosphingosinicella sp.]
MRRSLPFLVLLLATAASCGQAIDNRSRPPAGAGDTANATDVAEPDAIPAELPAPRARPSREAGPGIDPESAPGVAFDYRYSFRLEADRVAEMQQEHQRLCERYGSRCRITGMDYRAANEDDVEAMLSFLVDPRIAGQFGREGVRAVEAADGELADSQVSGTEIGTALKRDTGNLAELRAELDRVEARLAQANLRGRERARLEDERQSLRQQIAGLRETTAQQESALATTPILFRYGSGNLAPGPARAPTLGEAFESATDTFRGGVNMLLVMLVMLSPWVLAGLGIWWLVRLLRRRQPVTPEA